MSTNLHAHVSTASADCDGPMYRDYVLSLSESELAEHIAADGVNDFHEIHFMERALCSVASPYAACQMTVKIDDDGIDVYERTEEGYRSAQVRWCRDECDENETSQRDVYAELAGY